MLAGSNVTAALPIESVIPVKDIVVVRGVDSAPVMVWSMVSTVAAEPAAVGEYDKLMLQVPPAAMLERATGQS